MRQTLFIILLYLLSSCTTFRYAVLQEFESPSKVIEKREMGVVRVESSLGNRIACYTTFLLYGGWCWFISPTDESDVRAREKANLLRKGDGHMEVRYIDRD